jgi:hypothetical protein
MRVRISFFELAVLLLLSLLLIASIYDLNSAWHARACSEPPVGSSGCYPWGSAGPVADSPNYRSKDAYIRSGLVFCFTLAVAMAVPLFVTRIRYSLFGIALVFLTGRLAVGFL